MEMDNRSELGKTERRRTFLGFCVNPQARILYSIVSTFVWMGFSLYWVAFFWKDFNFFQNLVSLALAFFAFCLTNAVLWVLE
jgi:hypothetical protein